MKSALLTVNYFFLACFLSLFFLMTVTKAQDTIPPVIKLYPGSSGSIELFCKNGPYVDPGGVATDNLEGDITSRMVVTGFVNTRRIGTYTITYFVKDTSGNSTTATRTVSVADTKGGNGFKMDSMGNDFYCHTDAITLNRFDYNWYIDGKRIRGFKDLKIGINIYPDTLQYYHDDTLSHEIRLDQYYCNNDTMISCTKVLSGRHATGVAGAIFTDENSNCKLDQKEWGVNLIPIKLYDSANQWMATTYSLFNGSYYFKNAIGKVTVMADTNKLPIELSCPANGNTRALNLGTKASLKENIDFGFKCTNQFDVGVGAFSFHSLRPGQRNYLYMDFNDLSASYGLHCTKKIGARVKVKVEGKLKYVDTFRHKIKPDSVQGNEFTFIINDLSKRDSSNANYLFFDTDSTAQIGDTVTASIRIYPPIGDLNPDNNSRIFKGLFSNSRDPNYKEVFPAQVKPAYSDWLNYTIHFQNNGNDSAIIIRLRDTLSFLLDIETFELLGSSHRVETSLNKNALMFCFRDIMLPDSMTDPLGSQGFVQYRIKPKKNLTEGTNIPNKAFIYFDYNSPIITNAASVEFKTPKQTLLKQINYLPQLNIYPNPGTGLYTMNGSVNSKLIVYNIYGQVVFTGTITASQQVFDFRNLANGFYLVKMDGVNGSFIKQ